MPRQEAVQGAQKQGFQPSSIQTDKWPEAEFIAKKKKLQVFPITHFCPFKTLKLWHEWQFFLLNVFAPPVSENHIPATVGGVRFVPVFVPASKYFPFFLAALSLIPNDKSLKTGFV